MHYLKLSAELLNEIHSNEKHRLLLKGIIQLASALRLKCIQKGVETEQQHQLLKALGCRYAQGVYYAKPRKLQELIELIKLSDNLHH